MIDDQEKDNGRSAKNQYCLPQRNIDEQHNTQF
jgi:hypothetical protein